MQYFKLLMSATMALMVAGFALADPVETQGEDTLPVAQQKGKGKGAKGQSGKGQGGKGQASKGQSGKGQGGKGNGKPKKKNYKHDGHKLMPKDKMKQLGKGQHQLGTHGKHKSLVSLKNGKVNGMHVQTPQGKKQKMKMSRKMPKSGHAMLDGSADVLRASLDGDDAKLIRTQSGSSGDDSSGDGSSGQMAYFVFSAQGVTIIIAFPISSLSPQLGGSDDGSGDNTDNTDDSGN